ncbi:hypothetical protein ST64987_p0004 (plasmid) [Streptococcus thermophilus]|nr:hypothetical protein ST64987_p0004 [Streptococcus thermophilus]
MDSIRELYKILYKLYRFYIAYFNIFYLFMRFTRKKICRSIFNGDRFYMIFLLGDVLHFLF